MELPYQVETLDDVPEEARSLYQERDGAFVLPVSGVKTADEISGLESALAKLKREREDLRKKAARADQVSDDDLADLERFRAEAAKREEEEAKKAGRWDEMREKMKAEHQADLEKVNKALAQKDAVIEKMAVTNELRSAIAKAGVRPEVADAVEAMLEKRGPKVVWEDEGTPKGVFPDELHGDKPILDYVSEWVKKPEAEWALPPKQAGGGGASGQPPKEGAGNGLAGKSYADLTPDEKVEYTQQKYGGEAAA